MSNNEHEHEHHDKTSTFHITINTRPHEVSGPSISYREVVNLAFPGTSEDIIYKVHYAGEHHLDGILHDGEFVELENGMKFDVHATNRS